MTQSSRLTLISHRLCPYVQRAAIVLAEKRCAFERHDIDLANKPDWFLAISPLGKTPVLQVDDEAIFESAVICEFIDETVAPRLLPSTPLARAKHRSYIELASALLNSIAGFYNAVDEAALQARALEIRARLVSVERVLGDGPCFAGSDFGLVDAAFAPALRYFDVFDRIGDFGCFDGLPRVTAWRGVLAARPSVREAVRADYPALLREFIAARRSALSQRLGGPA